MYGSASRWSRRGRAERASRSMVGSTFFFSVAILTAACSGTNAPGTPSSGSVTPATSGATTSPAISPTPSAAAARPTAVPSPTATPGPTPLPDGVLASIPLGEGPRAGDAPSVAVVGPDSVWVETHRGTTLYRIDPTTNKIAATIDLGQESCGEPAVGLGRVWVGPCDSSTRTIVVDAATNQVVGTIDAGGGSIAFTKDALWMGDVSGQLAKVDPTTYKVVARYDTFHGGIVGWVVTAAGSLWAVQEDADGNWGGEIAKIDPATGSVVSRLSVPDPGDDACVTADLGFIWVKGDKDGRLLRIDPKTSAMTTFTLPGFRGLTQLFDIWPATGLGSVWVRLTDGTVRGSIRRRGR